MKDLATALAALALLASPALAGPEILQDAPVTLLVEEKVIETFEGILPSDAEIVVQVADDAPSGSHIERFVHDRASGRFSATLRKGEGNLVTVPGKVEVVLPALVPARRVAAGEVLGRDDLREARLPISFVNPSTLRSPGEIVGMEVRRTLMPDRPIPSQSLVPPRAVRKGEAVEIVFEMKGMRLSAPGRAMEDGALGDLVRILNTASHKTILAPVEAPGRVRVEAQPAQVQGG